MEVPNHTQPDFTAAESFLKQAKEALAQGDEQKFEACRALVVVALGLPLPSKRMP